MFKPNLHEVFTSLNLMPEEVSSELLSDIHAQIKRKI